MWKYRESYSSPRSHRDLEKEVVAIFEDETIGLGSKKAEESAVRVHVSHVPHTGATDVVANGNLKYKFTLSDSVWAVLRTKIQARNAMLANRPAEHTAVDFFHQPAIDRSAILTIADDHVAVSAMLKNRREPLWYSFAAWFGFAPRKGSETSHLEPHRVDLKLRWRPASVPAFEHSLFFLSASSSFLKSWKDYGSVAASCVSRFNRDWYFGVRLEADLNQKSSTGRQANSLPLDIVPRMKVGTLYAWEDQLITCKLNATITPRVTEEFSVKGYVEKTIEGMFFTPYAFVEYKHNALQSTQAGVGMKINLGSD
eukprot:TRINITY_DN5117_c0_g1_i1.p1 TRINITY_DN5117_c0_g1~~TRINITY_DN5117_c0_g1_i1.p1  ORF type:complete len:312 (-),score=36.13 TRINITY_DN5117_c0_g1_i1:86-1021(-)